MNEHLKKISLVLVATVAAGFALTARATIENLTLVMGPNNPDGSEGPVTEILNGNVIASLFRPYDNNDPSVEGGISTPTSSLLVFSDPVNRGNYVELNTFVGTFNTWYVLNNKTASDILIDANIYAPLGGQTVIPGGIPGGDLTQVTDTLPFSVTGATVMDNGSPVDVNITLVAAVPEPGTWVAGIMLLLPFGAGILRKQTVA
jgi:hypothetical protein